MADEDILVCLAAAAPPCPSRTWAQHGRLSLDRSSPACCGALACRCYRAPSVQTAARRFVRPQPCPLPGSASASHHHPTPAPALGSLRAASSSLSVTPQSTPHGKPSCRSCLGGSSQRHAPSVQLVPRPQGLDAQYASALPRPSAPGLAPNRRAYLSSCALLFLQCSLVVEEVKRPSRSRAVSTWGLSSGEAALRPALHPAPSPRQLLPWRQLGSVRESQAAATLRLQLGALGAQQDQGHWDLEVAVHVVVTDRCRSCCQRLCWGRAAAL
mmetsp:Transcript_29569/g.68771  ORF Transcript_29569/g.68771 Transcript_29569/m.68771 type:complete len:270 (-) Transcript_29569:51-860(-)